jgi:membrane associated rhomboid family serine protease
VSDPQKPKIVDRFSAQMQQPFTRMPVVVLVVISLLVLIHGFLQLSGHSIRAFAEFAFAFIPARFGNTPFPQIQGSAYWSMLTYGLLHADWTHLGLNSLWLVIFSKPVALRLGTLRYLVLLTVSIFAGAVAGLVVHWGEVLVMVGISAGVSGMIAAAIPIMYAENFHELLHSHKQLHDLRPLSVLEILKHQPALIFTTLWLGLTIFTATSQYLTGTAFLEERVVAWEAHLGGFIAGFIAFYLLDKSRVTLNS